VEPTLVVLIAGVTVAAVAAGGLAVRASRQAKQRRTDELRDLADRLGWSFRDEVPYDALPKLDRFELFRPGRAKKVRNVMTSAAGARRMVLFDYQYETGGGNSHAVHKQTVCYVVDDALDLPAFSLRPENFFHRVGAMFGYQDTR
jgi:hypothetical protein